MTVLVCADAQLVDDLAGAIGAPIRIESVDALRRVLPTDSHDLVVLGPDVDLAVATEFAADQRLIDPDVGVLLLRHRVDVTALGSALRAGVRDVVPVGDLPRLRDACRTSTDLTTRHRAARGATPAAPAGRGRVVTVFGGKGGAGSTTVAVSIAVLLAEHKRVCLIDLDLAFGDIAMGLRLFPERTLGDAVGMGENLDAAGVQALTTRHASGVHALLAPTVPGAAEHVPAGLVARLLEIATELYDVVVVDTPSAFTDPVLAAFDASDLLFLVTTPDVAATKNHKLVEQTLDALDLPGSKRRLVLNRADATGGLSPEDLQTVLGRRPAFTVPESRVVPDAANRGTPVSAFAPRDPVVRALRGIADAASGLPTAMPRDAASRENAPARRSVFGRRVVTP